MNRRIVPLLSVLAAVGLLALSVAQRALAQSEIPVTPPPPRIVSLVPEHAAAGVGQTLTIQGLNLLVPGATVVTLTPLLGGTPTSCVTLLPPAPSGSSELYLRLGVFDSVNPPGCTGTIPSAVPAGLYRVTVTTPGGTSNAARLAVYRPPATPVPRRLLNCLSSPCVPATTFAPGEVLGIQAYGSDLLGATAQFVQGTTAMTVPSHATFIPSSPSERSLVNAFLVPTGLVPGPALVRLRTELAAAGGGGTPDPPSRSGWSFSLVFTVPGP